MRLPPRSRLSRTEGRAGCPARPRHAALEQVCASPRPPWSSAGLKSWPGPSRGVLSCRLPWWPSGSDSGLPPQGVGLIPGQGSATPQALHSQEKQLSRVLTCLGLQVALVVTSLPALQETERQVCPRVGKIPWRRARRPTAVFLPGESRGHRSRVHGVAKSRTRLQRLSTHISFSTYFPFHKYTPFNE